MAVRILVIDDEPDFEDLIRQIFRKKIRTEAYAFAFASNGMEALEILKEDKDFKLILCDINMPGMDGLTFLSKLHPLELSLKVIMVSAYGDMNNIRAAMNMGAFDFVNKPIEMNDLRTTVEKSLKEVRLMEQAKAAKELERRNEELKLLDQQKNRFFTNISHEFRTPLTVILGLSEQILNKREQMVFKEVSLIHQNGAHLLRLVNQILDLRKLEAGKLRLNMVQGDICHFLENIMASFETLAKTKELSLNFFKSEKETLMDFDQDKLLSIFYNLLNNAIKYNRPGGKVNIRVERLSTISMLQIAVQDTGQGIPTEDIPHIFEPFFRSSRPRSGTSEGTGIGLTYASELVKLLGGALELESEVGVGSTFRVQLPITNQATQTYLLVSPVNQPPEPAITEEALESIYSEKEDKEKPRLLIVEDNPDIIAFISACVEDTYQVIEAQDGVEGIATAIELVPDVIISDVMMPRKDGFELCETLKNDERTSHIPIILLTAKADMDSRLTGLGFGADAYLTKPFEQKELLIRLEKLVALRSNLQKRYQNLEKVDPAQEFVAQQQDAFIQKFKEVILSNLNDVHFKVPEICRELAMSRSQLHRKIKALTGQSVTHVVRDIRLKKGHELLLGTNLQVSEIAYDIGFSAPNYFIRLFKEKYGATPKEIRK